jgi:hypothetical protein
MSTKTRTRSTERNDFLATVIVTAVEGGINYWAAVSDYEFVDGPNYSLTSASVRVHEDADATDFDGETIVSSTGMRVPEEGVLVTLDTIASAVQKIARGDAMVGEPGHFDPLGDYAVKLIREASAANDAGDIDSDMADIIMQVAVIGHVRYG